MRRVLSALRQMPRRRAASARFAAIPPSLAALFLWRANQLPTRLPEPLWLHFGCGENVIDGFLNLDFLPHDARVVEWDFLDVWPETWTVPARGALSEDLLEHFFLAEQLYILCEVNRALAGGAVFRVLMPALDRLLEYSRGFAPRDGELLYTSFGVETEADAVNVGMRFSGHRWLHDDRSLGHLAGLAGFAAQKTSCSESSEAFLSGRNIRSEEGTAAFAHDLVKQHALERSVVAAGERVGLERLEDLSPDITLLRVQRAGAELRYRLPRPLPVAAIACVNVRSANMTSFREHSLKRFVLRDSNGAEGSWQLDETLKSKSCMNVLTPAMIRLALGGSDGVVEEVALLPGSAGDLVTAGALEVFVDPRAC